MDKLHAFLGKAIVDFGATFNAGLVRIGDKLGLYKSLAKSGPQTPAELAHATGTTERYIREWLSNQAAGGYVTYDPSNGKFHLSEEQAFAMADENSPAFLPGAFQVAPNYSWAPSAFSARATRPIWSARGFLPWRAWKRN
jgi:hypothetical protein